MLHTLTWAAIIWIVGSIPLALVIGRALHRRPARVAPRYRAAVTVPLGVAAEASASYRAFHWEPRPAADAEPMEAVR